MRPSHPYMLLSTFLVHFFSSTFTFSWNLFFYPKRSALRNTCSAHSFSISARISFTNHYSAHSASHNIRPITRSTVLLAKEKTALCLLYAASTASQKYWNCTTTKACTKNWRQGRSWSAKLLSHLFTQNHHQINVHCRTKRPLSILQKHPCPILSTTNLTQKGFLISPFQEILSCPWAMLFFFWNSHLLL